MQQGRVRKGVVLAAGLGSRMRPLTQGEPKVLVRFGGQPLVLYAVQALAHAGIEDVAVVVGHKAEAIRSTLGHGEQLGLRLRYVFNPYYRGGNALSVLMAKHWLGHEPFILCMGDHVMEKELVPRLLDTPSVRETLCVDRAPRYCVDVDEATKVQTDILGLITQIGKGLDPWDAVDTGVFLLTHRFIEAATNLILLSGMRLEISEVIQSIVDSGGRFATCDVTGLFWADMDTQEDLYSATSRGKEWSLDTMASSRDT